jgi:hypothetical protein
MFASMCFCRFYCHVQHHRDLLGSLVLAQELHDLALPRRQFGHLGHGWTNAMPLQVTVQNPDRTLAS